MKRGSRRPRRRSPKLEGTRAHRPLIFGGLKRRRDRSARRRESSVLTALDLGTTHVKAAVCHYVDGRILILGQGLEPYVQRPDNGDGAPSALALACENAVCQAEDMTEESVGHKVVPDQVVVAVPSSTMLMDSRSLRYNRRFPDQPIGPMELARALRSAQRAALQDVRQANTALRDAVLLGKFSAVQMDLDGHHADDPVGLRAAVINITTFNVLASEAVVAAIEALADQLKFDPPSLAIQPQAVLLAWSKALGLDGIGIDVGGRHTTVSLWQGGLLGGAVTVPMGGRDFTTFLAKACQLDERSAEKLKVAYARDQLEPSQARWLADVLRPQLERWARSVRHSLAGLGRGQALPSDMWVWGGGANLGDIYGALEAMTRDGQLTFAGYPTIRPLPPSGTSKIIDRTGLSMGLMGINVHALAFAHASRGHPSAFDDQVWRSTVAACQSENLQIWIPADG